GATDARSAVGFAPIAIGLALTLIHLISLPVTNTSVNPARSTAVAVFTDAWALKQLWLFWVAPLIGAAIAGLSYSWVTGEKRPEVLPVAVKPVPPKAKPPKIKSAKK
ncbi:MAG: aquaporin, partial [Angustibacter sp.]